MTQKVSGDYLGESVVTEAVMKRPPKKIGGIPPPSFYSEFVIQKYIERPLTFKNFKFEVRVFALYTHKREVYVFE